MYIRTRVCVYVHVFLRVAGKDLSQIYPSQISEVCMYVIHSYVYNTRAYISCVYRYIYIYTHTFSYTCMRFCELLAKTYCKPTSVTSVRCVCIYFIVVCIIHKYVYYFECIHIYIHTHKCVYTCMCFCELLATTYWKHSYMLRDATILVDHGFDTRLIPKPF